MKSWKFVAFIYYYTYLLKTPPERVYSSDYSVSKVWSSQINKLFINFPLKLKIVKFNFHFKHFIALYWSKMASFQSLLSYCFNYESSLFKMQLYISKLCSQYSWNFWKYFCLWMQNLLFLIYSPIQDYSDPLLQAFLSILNFENEATNFKFKFL
jgi:hypothetical protein